MPEETGVLSEFSPIMTTVCFRLSKKSLIHFQVSPLMSYGCNFSLATLSKALLKSNKIKSVCLPICIIKICHGCRQFVDQHDHFNI